ncbi:MAG: AAA family ATPase [Gammaproteobacteria bacterium]|nr:AAA family ATPase [Gammaproteobacteria bacterium]
MVEPQAELKDLFRPGTGVEPPYLAGRLEEQAFFNDRIEKLVEGQHIVSDMIVYGPRGNGKTAMLRYLQKRTDDRLETLWVTPSEFDDTGQLVELIAGNDPGLLKRLGKIIQHLLGNLSASASLGPAQVKTTLGQPGETIALKDLLREKCERKPFIMIMDEAHTLNPDIGRVLLNVSQEIRGEDCPFFLVLAGTPNLRTELRRANATFWSRSAIFPLGRLSSEEAQEALTIPLERYRVTFDPEALEEVSSRAHRYPYFIQLWGDCIANRLVADGLREVTMDTVREVEREVMVKCHGMYQDRYDELQELNLHWLAAHVGQAFSETGRKHIPGKEFKELVGKALQDQGVSATHESVMDNIRQLSHIGYVWEVNVPGDMQGEYPLLCYEPGIPSLMQYVGRQVLDKTKD